MTLFLFPLSVSTSIRLGTTKAKASDKSTKGKSVINGRSETVEPSEAKAKPKRKKKEEKIIRAPTPVELDAVRDTIQQILTQRDLERSMGFAPKEDRVSSAPARAAKPSSSTSMRSLPKVVSSANILAAAKQRGANRPAPSVDRPAETAPVPTKLSLAHSTASESSDEDGDYSLDNDQTVSKPPLPIPTPNPVEQFANINLEALVRGPRRRLTLDSVLPAAIASNSRKRNPVVLEEEPIVKQLKSGKRALSTRPSGWSDSESDDAGYESATAEEAEPNGHKIPHPSVVNISNDSKTNSTAGLGEHAVPDDQTLIGPSVEEMSEMSTVLSDGVSPTLATEQTLPDSPPTDEHDPIEPILPSPRSHSPIESVLATATPLINNTPTTKTPSKPVTGLRRSNRNPASQPLSKHEVDVRESVVRLTRNRSKQSVQMSVQAASPSPSIPQPSPRRLRSASKPRSTLNKGSVISQESSTPRGNVVESSWTTLKPDLPSSSPAPESTQADELQSFPNDEQPSTTLEASDLAPQQPFSDAAPSGNPLFLASDSQIDFPYSQFQDIADTDTGAEEPMPTVGRLEQDSEEEDEVEETITVKTSRRGSTTYRGLSQITGQNRFFAGFPSQSVVTSTPKNSNEDMYGPMSQAYNDDASDSDSENEKSHIPRSRRAGNKQ
ncbi:hypothetical protein BDP27DRAFT_291586 [Rhodocollybia butyracea]|uniref:Uncharacterized protein n=1 Tax=Rhodocollybia butyracea TaxID=206335 RepID=A0A9P5U1J2_9AGAR|nr:hypothetical protein BDP27DRAFT_291586 [Rhodocollybia butyracea]